MFLVNNEPGAAMGALQAVATMHNEEAGLVKDQMERFIRDHLPEGGPIDLFLSGENGDTRMTKYYEACESLLNRETGIARFKHFTGEFHTASGAALWLACRILQDQKIPDHMIKRRTGRTSIRNILIYNNVRGYQHGFMLITLPA